MISATLNISWAAKSQQAAALSSPGYFLCDSKYIQLYCCITPASAAGTNHRL